MKSVQRVGLLVVFIVFLGGSASASSISESNIGVPLLGLEHKGDGNNVMALLSVAGKKRGITGISLLSLPQNRFKRATGMSLLGLRDNRQKSVRLSKAVTIVEKSN